MDRDDAIPAVIGVGGTALLAGVAVRALRSRPASPQRAISAVAAPSYRLPGEPAAMSSSRRSPDTAKALVDRAARGKFRPGILDRRLFDQQMRTPSPGRAPVWDLNTLGANDLEIAGRQRVPLNHVVSNQPTVSVAQVKGKIDAISSGAPTKPAMLLEHNGRYHVMDGNHRLTAQRALGQADTEALVFRLKTAGRAASQSSSTMSGMAAIALPVGIATAAYVAASQSAEAGESVGTRTRKAAAAGGTAAATGAAVGGLVALAAKAAPVVAGALKVAGPVGLAVGAAYGGYRGYQQGGARGAAIGAFTGGYVPQSFRTGGDTTTNQIAALDKAPPTKAAMRADEWPRREPIDKIPVTKAATSRDDLMSFQRAERDYGLSAHGRDQAEPDAKSKGKRGFAHPKVQRAAQEARGVTNFTGWAQE